LIALSIKRGAKTSWGLARLKADGTLDEGFASGGLWNDALDRTASNEAPYSVVVDDAGRIVLGGLSADAKEFRRLTVARFDPTGKPDGSFGPAGKGHVILSGYGAQVNNRYGPRAAVWKDRIAVTGAVALPASKNHYFGLAVLDNDGKTIGKLMPRPFPDSKGTDLPWGVGFDTSGRVLVGGVSIGLNGKKRFAVARYLAGQ